MVKKHLKRKKTRENDSLGLKMYVGKFFWGGKTENELRNSKYYYLDPFCDVTDP